MHQTFKGALHESIFRSTLPAKAIADRVGVSYQTLHEFADDARDTNIPVRRLIALVTAADNLAVLDYLEQLAGRIAFRIPTGAHLSSTGEAIKQFGEWVTVHGDALSDGVISASELAAVEQEGQEAIAAIAAAIEHARSRVHPPALKAVR